MCPDLRRLLLVGKSQRKYYFVQISTGVSTWDVPTEVAPGVPTPGPTPQAQADAPFAPPSTTTMGDREEYRAGEQGGEHGEQSDRGLGVRI